MDKAKIVYRNFYDVPRIFVVFYRDLYILFDCTFDESIDEYPNIYKVFLLSNIDRGYLKMEDWSHLSNRISKYIGKVAIQDIEFDITKRKEIDTKIIDNLIDTA